MKLIPEYIVGTVAAVGLLTTLVWSVALSTGDATLRSTVMVTIVSAAAVILTALVVEVWDVSGKNSEAKKDQS